MVTNRKSEYQGFSLVELSVVLVILGLLTGGILTGKSLIRASELRAVVEEFDNYRAAVIMFEDKYYAFPGDIDNATDFWGIRAGTTGSDAACWTATSTSEATCNGNGDGFIRFQGGMNGVEVFLFWQHLANAGLIQEGQFAGRSASGNNWDCPPDGTYCPTSKMSNTGWAAITELNRNVGQTDLFENYDGDTNLTEMTFGTYVSTNFPKGPALTPTEAWGIDTKIDDGHPAYGLVFNYKNTSTIAPNCTTGATADAGEYNLTNDSIACALWFYEPFNVRARQ